jgi:hypothetical protein
MPSERRGGGDKSDEQGNDNCPPGNHPDTIGISSPDHILRKDEILGPRVLRLRGRRSHRFNQ